MRKSSGGINGFTAMATHVPEWDLDVVVLSNTAGSHPFSMADAIVRWVLGLEMS